MNENELVFDLEGVKKYYPVTKGMFKRVVGHVKAVDGVDLQVRRGETLGIVGESGCGKSTLGKAMMMLERPTAGRLNYCYDGQMRDLLKINASDLFDFRSKVQMIFQDPYSSLNPQKTIREAFDEPMRIHGAGDKAEREAKMMALMEQVNLRPEMLDRYPHEFSGGQRQRICIARVLSVGPDTVICDEPVSALDVSIQAQVLNLMKDLQDRMGLTYIFIAHDLSVVQFMSDRIAVMYLGKIVELADAKELYDHPQHPYTKALLSAIPIPSLAPRPKRIVLEGDVPSPINKPTGCCFHTRCKNCMEKCRTQEPELKDYNGHKVACHLMEEP